MVKSLSTGTAPLPSNRSEAQPRYLATQAELQNSFTVIVQKSTTKLKKIATLNGSANN